jgi:hypothetical protein
VSLTKSPLVFAVLGGALALVVVVLAVVVASRFLGGGSPATAPSDSARVAAVDDGLHAPGTEEVRAIGCDRALVLDMQRVLGSSLRPGDPRTIVTCDVASKDGAPTCERVASTYFSAVKTAEANVAVRVMREAPPEALCARVYAPSGADIGPLEAR